MRKHRGVFFEIAMKTVRLTSGLGFYGDNCLPVLAAIAHGDVQYVCSDHLAELTLAILQKDRQRTPPPVMPATCCPC